MTITEDPRVSRSKSRILDSAADLLVREGAAAATIERIAAGAGVARTTVYRHWPSRSHLVMDAFETLAAPPPVPATDDLRRGLLALLAELAWALTESRRAPMLPALVDAAERDEELANLQKRHTEQRRKPMRLVIEAAITRGEIPRETDTELALDQLSGPLFYRRLITHRPITKRFLEQVVDGAIAAWQSPPHAS
ncbi:MAG: TetR/AcrR family transcriptional regulator, partial [Dehalococcoidia bacterium]